MAIVFGSNQIQYYEDGNIPSEWIPYLISNTVYDPVGTWELMLDRSDTCEEIMATLNIPRFKRKLMKSHQTINKYEVISDNNESEQLKVRLITYLPLGTVKSGDIIIDGKPYDQFDTDTRTVWSNEAIFLGKQLLQKRTSSLGIMYDVRCVFSEDPEHQTDEKPLYLFRWTLITPDGKKVVVNRWHKLQSNKK